MHLVYPPEVCIHCFQFLQGITVVPREIENNGCAKFWGINKVHYGLCENGEWFVSRAFLYFACVLLSGCLNQLALAVVIFMLLQGLKVTGEMKL